MHCGPCKAGLLKHGRDVRAVDNMERNVIEDRNLNKPELSWFGQVPGSNVNGGPINAESENKEPGL